MKVQPGQPPSGDKPDGNGGFGGSTSRGWGTQGANGGDVVLDAKAQKIEGNIVVDSISSLDFSMTEASSFTGAINSDGDAGTVNVSERRESYVSQSS